MEARGGTLSGEAQVKSKTNEGNKSWREPSIFTRQYATFCLDYHAKPSQQSCRVRITVPILQLRPLRLEELQYILAQGHVVRKWWWVCPSCVPAQKPYPRSDRTPSMCYMTFTLGRDLFFFKFTSICAHLIGNVSDSPGCWAFHGYIYI